MSVTPKSFIWYDAADPSAKGRFVLRRTGAGNDKQVAYCETDTGECMGVTAEDDVAIGGHLAVHTIVGELVILEASAAIAQDDKVTATTDGKAKTAASGDNVMARAVTAAAAAGDYFWAIFYGMIDRATI